MAHLIDKPEAAQQAVRQRATELQLWLALTGGSIVIHLLAVAVLLPIASRAAVREKSLEVSPIDFVELPGTKNAASSKGASVEPTIASPIPAQPPAVPRSAPEAQSDSGNAINSGDIGLAPPAESPITPVITPTLSPSAEASEPKAPESPTPLTAEPTAEPLASAPDPQPSIPDAPPQQSAPGQSDLGQANPGQSDLGQSDPIASSAPPSVTTEQITAAVPDTSAQYSAENQPVPLTLMASLQVVAVPPEQLETPPPDTIAQPLVSTYTFSPNPKDTICVPESEAAQFAVPGGITLGEGVGVQVATDEMGQVIDTALWQPSQNSLNNQLATCLVKNWNWKFQPAIAQGQPVASKALVIWVKIDQSQGDGSG